jgi:hypothetical protein
MLALLGFIVYVVTTKIPMPEIFKQAIIVIVVILIILYLVKLFGFDIPLPR